MLFPFSYKLYNGISTNKDIIAPHLIKNIEWGAVAYLAHSVYGRNGIEVTANLSGFTIGNGNYKSNVTMSTTGNVYGIYDMAGGTWELVAAYVDSTKGGTVSISNLTSTDYGKALYYAINKYRDVYMVGKTDNMLKNYLANANKYGDGIFETSYNELAWFKDITNFPFYNEPFIYRGGCNNNGENAGIFAFNNQTGSSNSYYGFRTVLVTP